MLFQRYLGIILTIGLRNVHERLQRFFGESYGLTIEGKEGEGTTIRLSFVA